jgi:hypothetical protein
MDSYFDAMEAAYASGPKNLCMGCKRDMGPMNPRQLCGKTHCPYLDESSHWAWESDAGVDDAGSKDGDGGSEESDHEGHSAIAIRVPTEDVATGDPRLASTPGRDVAVAVSPASSAPAAPASIGPASRADGKAAAEARVAEAAVAVVVAVTPCGGAGAGASAARPREGSESASALRVAGGSKGKVQPSIKRSSSDMLNHGASAPKMTLVEGDDTASAAVAAVKRMRLAASALARAAGEFESAAADVELALFTPFRAP